MINAANILLWVQNRNNIIISINSICLLRNLYGAITERTSIPTWLLFTFLCHTLLYFGYYLMSKVRSFNDFCPFLSTFNLSWEVDFQVSLGERILAKTWVYLSAALIFCCGALIFYFREVTNWSVRISRINMALVTISFLFQVTAAESREMNAECVLLNFFDSHDLWHILSAVGIFFIFSVSFHHD